MKDKLITIGAVSVFIIYAYFFWIRPDYTWSEIVIEEKTKENWTLITTSETWRVAKPWTWIKPQITNLWFVKPENIVRLDSNLMMGNILSASYEDDKTTILEYSEIFNCSEEKSVIIFDPNELNKLNSNSLSWQTVYKNSPEKVLMDYYCSKNKEYTMTDFLGREVDISNYIISGRYSLVDSTGYIFEIKNNKPYIPKAKDERLIRNAITNWLNEQYPNQNFILPKNLFSISKYEISRMGFGIPDDIYSIELTPNEIIGKLKIEFDFSKQAIPPQYEPKDEVRILNEDIDER